MAPYSQGKLLGARSMLTTPLPAAANVPAHLPLAGKWCSPWAIEEDDGLEAGCRGGAAVAGGRSRGRHGDLEQGEVMQS
uniref:Uncharacterized protein n=1 Tax=Oryza barthii TaxID=65489 RepID=A0A0D3GFA6_9ORYZ